MSLILDLEEVMLEDQNSRSGDWTSWLGLMKDQLWFSFFVLIERLICLFFSHFAEDLLWFGLPFLFLKIIDWKDSSCFESLLGTTLNLFPPTLPLLSFTGRFVVGLVSQVGEQESTNVSLALILG